ncbi:MAG: hypothetical protein K2I53_07290, partial [Lachnospiraceae bacterium]|nr:hypothetical protein [Lachnospiraceae bacterium]
QRDLLALDRRQRQMCIRDRLNADYRENGADLPRTEERTLRSDGRRVNYMVTAAVFVLLSAAAGIAGFYAHSRSGTNR